MGVRPLAIPAHGEPCYVWGMIEGEFRVVRSKPVRERDELVDRVLNSNGWAPLGLILPWLIWRKIRSAVIGAVSEARWRRQRRRYERSDPAIAQSRQRLPGKP